MTNHMELKFLSKSENESFARTCVAAFIATLDPTVEELMELKTVVSEAVTNAIIHGYEGDPNCLVILRARIIGQTVTLEIEDSGKGIDNLEEAMQPLFTTKPELS